MGGILGIFIGMSAISLAEILYLLLNLLAVLFEWRWFHGADNESPGITGVVRTGGEDDLVSVGTAGRQRDTDPLGNLPDMQKDAVNSTKKQVGRLGICV